jgi:small-conductance mechanosensitive channel
MIMPAPKTIVSELADIWFAIQNWVASHTVQIGISVLSGIVLVALMMAAKRFGVWLLDRDRASGHWPQIVGKTLARTKIWFMIAVTMHVVALIGKAPADVAAPIRMIFVIAMGFQAAIWVRALILGLVERRAGQSDPNGGLESAVGIIRLLVTIGVFTLATILILANLGINVTGLLAGLGIGGIAIGLAAKGIFDDLFAALTILFDKPFRKGDVVRWDATVGTVENIGLKSSRVRATSGEEIVISNTNLLNKELRNFARLETRRISQPLALAPSLPVEQCAQVGQILEPAINACPGTRFIRCGLENFGPSSLEFTLVYDIAVEDQGEVLMMRDAVNLAILTAFASTGIRMAQANTPAAPATEEPAPKTDSKPRKK